MTSRQEALGAADEPTRTQAKRMIRSARHAALACLAPGSGWPAASRVALSTAIDGAPVFLASDLALHSAALEGDARCSLLIGEPGKGDPLAHPRLTLFCRASRVAREADAALRRRYLARHPKAALYADFGDFHFWRGEIEGADFNGGFGRACELTPADLAPARDPAPLAEAAERAAAQMNAEKPDIVAHLARLAGGDAGRWALTGIDPEGCDLADGDKVARLDFVTPVADAAGLRAALIALARRSL